MNNQSSLLTPKLWTIGYGAWPVAVRAERLVEALQGQSITLLADVRLNPCASQLSPGNYGPKPWNLQLPGEGIVTLLGRAGIAYEWIAELGNPQRQDPEMAILKTHLADSKGHWPVHRGLRRLAERIANPDERVAILCACAQPAACHRSLIAREARQHCFAEGMSIFHISAGGEAVGEAP